MRMESQSWQFVARGGAAWLLLLCLGSTLGVAVPVGPDIEARANLIKDLPSGIFAGMKIPSKVRDKTLIQMSLSVRNIDLDFSKGIFSTSGSMTLEWDDPRYVWDPAQYDDIQSVPLPFSKVWAPEVILQNSVEEKFIFRQVGILHHTGHLVYVVSVHTKSTCQPNFEGFPWGIQVCSLNFGSWINSQYNVEYRIPRNSTVGLTDYEPTVGWNIVSTKAKLVSAQSRNPLFSEPTYLVVYDIVFQRDIYFDGYLGVLTKENRTTEL